MITIIRFRFDKMTLLRSFLPADIEIYNKMLGRAFHLRECGHLDYPKAKPLKYQTVFVKAYPLPENPCIYYKFGVTKYGSYITIDFTPRKLDSESKVDFMLTCAEMFGGETVVYDTFKIKLLEIAQDMDKPFNDFLFLTKNVQIEKTLYKDAGSLFFGAKYSNSNFIVYDKQKQLQECKGIESPVCTRVEMRIRNVGLSIEDLPTLPNPYQQTKILVIPRKIIKSLPSATSTNLFRTRLNQGFTPQQAYRSLHTNFRGDLWKRLEPKSTIKELPNKFWESSIQKLSARLSKYFTLL